MMKHGDTLIAIGGLFRCCLKELDEMSSDKEVYEGLTISCPQCNSSIILEDGTWRWNDHITKVNNNK